MAVLSAGKPGRFATGANGASRLKLARPDRGKPLRLDLPQGERFNPCMSGFTVTVTDSIRIARPIDIVRQQFGDVRHHAERQVHRGVTFTVLTDSAGECRYHHEVSVAGLRQVGEVVLTRAADGSQTNLFTSGPNTASTPLQSSNGTPPGSAWRPEGRSLKPSS